MTRTAENTLFLLPAALVIIALLGVIFGMPESPVKTPGRLDLLGAATLSVSLVSLLRAIGEGGTWGWDSIPTIALLIVGAAALVGFVFAELRVREPLIDMGLMKNRGVWTAHIIALVFGFVMFGTFILVPTLLQLPVVTDYRFGESVSQAGLFLLPTVGMMVLCRPIAGMLVRKIGPKPLMLLGSIAVTLAFVLPAIAHGEIWPIVISGICTGAGIGFALASMSNAIIESVPATQTGDAISVNTIARTFGSSVGTAVIAAIITSNNSPQGLPTDMHSRSVSGYARLSPSSPPSQRHHCAATVPVSRSWEPQNPPTQFQQQAPYRLPLDEGPKL